MVGIARGGMFRLQILTGSIIGVGVIGCRFCSYCYWCCFYYYDPYSLVHYYYHHPQTTHPSSRQSPLKNTDQRYQNN